MVLPSLAKASTSWPAAKLPVRETVADASVALSTSEMVRPLSMVVAAPFSV
jgi:hypothetical protein